MNKEWIIPSLIVAIFLVTLVVTVLYQRKLIRQIRTLAQQADESHKQILKEQERNRQLKQEMTNNIAHELKTPVSSIRGYLEILLSDKPIDEEKKRYFLDRCYGQTLRLSDLINDVSIINKLEESADLFPKEPIDVNAIAQEAIHELEDMAKDHHICIKNQLPASMPFSGNHSLVYAIFRNLVENALMYAGDGVDVVLESYKTSDERYYIHFYDTGKGVGNEYLAKIFDRFLRIEEGRSRKSGGTGLGLSIVKHAVLFHHGDIYAKNRDEGGLEFFFSLKKQS